MRRAALLLVLATTPACNLDTAIFVDGTLLAPSLSVESVLLGTKLGGGFDLDLHLGARASGPSTTSVLSFSLVDAAGVGLVDPLAVVADGPVQNLTIEPDTTTTIAFTVSGDDLVPSETVDAICGAGTVQFRGTFSDSLASAPTPLASDLFAPTGCP